MRTRLTPSRIDRLRPRAAEYSVWDVLTPHLGVRVMPTGTMRFIHVAPVDGRLRKRTLGDAKRMPLDEARALARGIDAGEAAGEAGPPCPTFGEWVDIWWPQAESRIKPTTRRGYLHALERQLLPNFRGLRLDGIGRDAILAWFERYSRSSPGGANYALNQLGMILNHARRSGLIQHNPVSRIPRNPGRKMTRILGADERRRLLSMLDATDGRGRMYALVVKLLLFTGCRRNEIFALRWSEIGDWELNLADSKTGSRKVWLCDEAVAVLDEVRSTHAETGQRSVFVFPSPRDRRRCLPARSLDQFWFRLRDRAGFPDVRLHDLRHSFASEAVRQGIPLQVVSKLLGHSTIRMTMRYVHASRTDVKKAAERIADRVRFDLSR